MNFLLVLLLVFAGCRPFFVTGKHPNSKPQLAKIAYVASDFFPDGTIATWGVNCFRAVQLGLKDSRHFKWAGSSYFLGLPSDLVYQANGTDAAELIAFVRYSVKSKVVAILGADWSRLSLAIVKELTNLGSKIPLISAGATTSLLSNSTEWPNFFRTTYSDSDAILSVLPVLSKLHQAKLGSLSDPPSWAVLYSQEPFGQGGHDTIQGYALSRGEAFQDAGFLSGASLQDLTDLAAKLLSSSTFSKQKPIIFITATGPDTTTVLEALFANGVRGAPFGDWIIGSTEGPASTVHNSSQIEHAAGYYSYLSTQPQSSGGSAQYKAFQKRFQQEFQGQLPTGGFAVSAYDSVVLTAKALKAAVRTSGVGRSTRIGNLRRTLRGLRIQGLGVPLVFPSGLNQPAGFPLDLLMLNAPSNSSDDVARTTLAAQINRQNLYPKYLVGSDLPPNQSI